MVSMMLRKLKNKKKRGRMREKERERKRESEKERKRERNEPLFKVHKIQFHISLENVIQTEYPFIFYFHYYEMTYQSLASHFNSATENNTKFVCACRNGFLHRTKLTPKQTNTKKIIDKKNCSVIIQVKSTISNGLAKKGSVLFFHLYIKFIPRFCYEQDFTRICIWKIWFEIKKKSDYIWQPVRLRLCLTHRFNITILFSSIYLNVKQWDLKPNFSAEL